MQKPDFSAVLRHAQVREPQQLGPQEVPYGQRLYKCECCNDSGVVQAWKLNRWASALSDVPLDSVMSMPVLCTHLRTCGEREIQVFAQKDTDENSPRTVRRKLSDGENIGHLLAEGRVKVLTHSQSQYIHQKVLEYRELLSVTEEGREYIAKVREAARNATPAEKPSPRLTHVGAILAGFALPEEPDLGDRAPAQERVQVTNPRDFEPEIEF